MLRKDCQDANNARNGDAFSVTKANGYLRSEKDANNAIETHRSSNYNETEDTIIEIIDLKNRKN